VTRTLTPWLLLASLAVLAPLPGCGKDKSSEEAKPVEVLDPASNGSPVAAKFVKFTGEGEERGLEVLLYNSGDKPAVAYHLLVRYFDANDQLLKVKPGTPFESDTDFTSMSGNKYKCESKQNQTLELDGMLVAVPAEAVRAEVLTSMVRTLAADGNTIEDWWTQEDWSQWPE
jgi:hypothetical protein